MVFALLENKTKIFLLYSMAKDYPFPNFYYSFFQACTTVSLWPHTFSTQMWKTDIWQLS